MYGCALILALGIASVPARAEDSSHYVEPNLKHAPFGLVKIVVPITSAEESVWMFKMANIRNAIAAARAFGGGANVRVVVYGRAVQMLRQSDTDLALQLDDLRHHDVEVLVCNNSLKAMDIDYHALHNVHEADIVPSGFLEVGWQQQQGYQVDPSN
jgi:intracellular sulfur oxidation DsrE/DsrF family protein